MTELMIDCGRSGAAALRDAGRAYLGGFATLEEEQRAWIAPDRIAGRLPAGLTGTLFRNGPGRNERGGRPFGHWFDGDGMLHAFTFCGGRVHAQNRYVRTTKYVNETRAGRITERSFGQERPGGPLANAGRRPANCANTGVVYHGGKLLALWEGGHPYRLDPATLGTIGPYTYGGQLGYWDTFSAHGKIDPRTGYYYNFGIRPTPRGIVANLYEVSPAGELVRRAALSVGAHPFVHDFALTEHYLVFFLSPLVMKGLVPYLLGLTTFDRALAFAADDALRILVVRRADFAVETTIETDPFFVAHHVNAWEDEDKSVVVDLVRFDDFRVNESLRNVLGGNGEEAPRHVGGYLHRVRIDLARRRASGHRLSDVPCEFPACDSRRLGAKHRVVYAAALLSNETPGFFNGILRLDSETGDATVHDLGAGRFTSEAIFVPASPTSPSANEGAEEDGHLVALVYDARKGRSEILFVDAREPSNEVARVELDHHVPYGFHGAFTRQVFL